MRVLLQLARDYREGTQRPPAIRPSSRCSAIDATPVALAGKRIIVDDLGFKVEVNDHIQRVVSLVPTNSEMVCLLDCERLKGGTRYDEFPAELKMRVQSKQIEIIGGGFDANLEKIVQLQPDLVLTNGPTQQRFAVPLKNMGYSVVSLWPRDMDGLVKDFLLLGELLGQAQKAQSVVHDIRARFQAIQPRRRISRRSAPICKCGLTH